MESHNVQKSQMIRKGMIIGAIAAIIASILAFLKVKKSQTKRPKIASLCNLLVERELFFESKQMSVEEEVLKEEKKANFRWSKQISKELLQFLAEQVRKGNRPNNAFRTTSFIATGKMISEKFQTTCTADHVENHMRTVRITLGIISQLRGKSGFG
ncbi:L10-interacting MYB domain-containing protein [Bienertia sinuspersici]